MMRAVIEVTEIMIISFFGGTDHIMMKTTLPMGLYPYRGKSVVSLEVASGKGPEFVEKHFSGMPYEHVKVGKK